MPDASSPSRRTLYPPIEPYATGRLDVGDGHSLYWERCGTPGAKPAIFLHGGPGAGCSPDHRRQFDPARYDMLLFDQRGCGRSTPHASLEANTTWHLVEDIEALREMAGVERWLVFGGSWGSTLALAYAQAHPDRASELVLRGIFTFRQSRIGLALRLRRLRDLPRQMAGLPRADPRSGARRHRRRLPAPAHRRRPRRAARAAKAWSKWEAETVTLLPDPHVIEEFTNDAFAIAIARIENHYMVNKGWLEEGQLIAGAGRLKGIPGVIVQGRYDCCTPPSTAWDLHQAWPEAELNIIPDGGHLFSEPGVLDGLIRATDRFAR